jgi:hypothetical protein
MSTVFSDAGRIVDALGEPLATRGHALLDRIARPWSSHDALAPSMLTPNGAPLELAFTTAAPEVRMTAEPSLPDDSPAAKWRAVRTFVPDSPLLSMLRAAPDQRFGCWLGARCNAAATSFKVYQEVAPSMQRRVPVPPPLKPMLVGASDDGTLEVYAAFPSPRPSNLHALFTFAGLAGWYRPALAMLAALASRSPARLFDEVRLGASLRPGVLTLFAPARQLFGEDERVARARILKAGPFEMYEQATRKGGVTHGMAGVAVSPAALHCWVGLTPTFQFGSGECDVDPGAAFGSAGVRKRCHRDVL